MLLRPFTLLAYLIVAVLLSSCSTLYGGPPGADAYTSPAQAGPSLAAKPPPGYTPRSVPSAPAPAVRPTADECLSTVTPGSVTPGSELPSLDDRGTLECRYFTSGSMSPPAVRANQTGFGSGDMAVRVSRFNSQPTLIVLVPCAAFTVEVGIAENMLTPAPETLETVLADCRFPWDDDQVRIERSLKEPLQFEWREDGIVLRSEDWTSTLFATPYGG